ncbi:MAG: CoA pyrophosphatase [Eubacteriales bacterium]|nr:CoA pyrophosphatase [Eubacteriales bacterium]MDD4122630.1 CoA pyrophosphatase [Eubacteriales bacterium]MDD4629095.1 CoA pyrophosphatase [Eubacteriales bacterium]
MKQISITDFEKTFLNRQPKSIGVYHYYSVLIPLVEKNGELNILYEVRADNLQKQPGEVCFPGGKIENDESPEECAIRETVEELNIDSKDIRIIAQMDFLHTYSNFTLYTILGVLDNKAVSNLSVNEDEVKEIFLVPLSFFVENKPEVYLLDVVPKIGPDFPYEKFNMQNGYNWRKGKSNVPFYRYKDRVIWGLTARITNHLIELVIENK